MPRGIRRTSMVEATTEEKTVTKKVPLKLGGFKIVPFDGNAQKLPTNEKNVSQDKVESRFYVNEKGLMMIYRTPTGVHRRLLTRIHKSKSGGELRQRLRKAGVPGA